VAISSLSNIFFAGVNAFAYMIFARIVHFYSPTRKVWFFSPSILALVFVTLDIVSFVVQLIGGGMAGPGSSTESQKKGLDLYMGGIGMQEAFIVLFLGLIVKFHRDQLQAERVGRLTAEKMRWRWLIWALYGCLLAITIRIIYRLVEFSAGLGASNPLPSNEPLLYVLESAPMWLATLVWNIVHPGRFIRGPDAKIPRSWLSRHICCCCGKRRCDECNGKLGRSGAHDHHRLAEGPGLEENHELQPIAKNHRGSVSVASANPFVDTLSRGSSPNGNAKDRFPPHPPPAANNPLEIRPEPLSYTAYRPREFSG